MVDLGSEYLGLALRTPLVASAGPHTGDVDGLRRLEDAGISAAVLPSLFEEEIVRAALQLDDVLEQGAESFGESLSYFPELDDYGSGPQRYLALVAEASERLSIPIVASLNASSRGGWVDHASLIQEAGAAALELNIYAVAADAGRTAADVESDCISLVRDVRAAVSIPLAVKLSPYYSSFAHFAGQVEAAGADGLVLFNRFYQPDLDLETLAVRPVLELSQPWELRLPLRWIAILRPLLSCSIAASSGITGVEGVLKALLVGADVTMMTSVLLREGPALVTRTEQGLAQWLETNDYESVRQLRGSVSYEATDDPGAFERANYARVLHSWEPR